MRITEFEAQAAVEVVIAHFGKGARIWLFGSRADDSRRGGDVDLYVEAASRDVMDEIRCKLDLEDVFGTKVDLVMGAGDKPIHQIAKETGVRIDGVLRQDHRKLESARRKVVSPSPASGRGRG
ncbi:putative uncharacterized protein [Burkholderiales bacterium GJ-E10]|nr:putative uncharacterized protein [Burkholderiales bacterium GJ-E10]